MTIPQVCTIAGSDSGGGAGIQADIKTFQERRVYGTSVITAVTVQNTLGVQNVYPVPLVGVKQQLEALLSDFELSAIKTGMLVDASYIQTVSDILKGYPDIPLIVDPVMIAKGGASLMAEEALEVLKTELLPLATIVTPNLPEAEALSGMTITTEADMENAAERLQAMGCRNVLIKGGHGSNPTVTVDYILLENGEEAWLHGERIETKDTHGTGCTLGACITAEIAKGHSIQEAVVIAKAFIQSAIANGLGIGHGHGPTNHWAYREEDNND